MLLIFVSAFVSLKGYIPSLQWLTIWCTNSIERTLNTMCMFDCRFEQAFVNSLVFGRSEDRFWLGLNNENSTGPFLHWLTGEKVTYTNWNRDQPGIHTHACMHTGGTQPPPWRQNLSISTPLWMSNKHRSISVQSNESHQHCVTFHASENDRQIWPDLPVSYMMFILACGVYYPSLLIIFMVRH